MCVETLTGVLFWSSDLLGKPFRAACFPFEALSGSLLLLLLYIIIIIIIIIINNNNNKERIFP